MNRYRNGGIPLGELNTHCRQHPVFGEAEGLCQRITADKDGAGSPDGTHHRYTNDAGNDVGLDKPLNTGDHQRIIDLQAGPGGVLTIGHLHDTVAVAGFRRHRERGGHTSGIVTDKIAGHDSAVTTQDNPGAIRCEVDSCHRNAGLTTAADIGRDLQHGRRLFKDRIRVDVALLGPVALFEHNLFRAR